MKKYYIAKEFSDAPGGRFRAEGEKSGEEFREDVLLKLVKDYEEDKNKIVIVFDGAFGYPTSFLEEAFGGLSRKIGEKKIKTVFDFESNDEPTVIDRVLKYIKEASIAK